MKPGSDKLVILIRHALLALRAQISTPGDCGRTPACGCWSYEGAYEQAGAGMQLARAVCDEELAKPRICVAVAAEGVDGLYGATHGIAGGLLAILLRVKGIFRGSMVVI